jgi:peptidyl-prolyl cis-trans isomerase B (cyclophilin B)
MLSLKVLALGFFVFGMVAAGTARAAGPVVVIETNQGTFKVELNEEKAPETVKNFLAYVDAKHYDGLIFHRVINDFMIQGGGFDADMKEKKTNPAIKNESSNGLENKQYTIAMARTSEPNSATSQFYINVKDNEFLNKAKSRDGVGYCVFGQVIDGKDVVDKIKTARTTTKNGMGDVPVEPVVIKSITREKK